MGQEIVYCFKCASRLLGADFDKGKAFRFEGKSVCMPCAEVLLETLPPVQRFDLAEIMEESSRRKITGSIPIARTPPRQTESSRKVKPAEFEPGPPPQRPFKAAFVIGALAALALLAVAAAVLSRPSDPAPRPISKPVDPDPPGPDPTRPPGPEANFARELTEIDGQTRALLAQEEFRQATDLLEAARKRHRERDWIDVIDRRSLQVVQEARKLLATVMTQALEARSRKAAADVAAARARVVKWGLASSIEEFDKALAAAETPPPPPPPTDGPPLVAYADALGRGWTDWSWGGTVDFANAQPVYEGSRSIAFTPRQGSAGLYLHSNVGLNTAEYPFIVFAAQAARPDVTFTIQLYDENNKSAGKPRELADVGGLPPVGSWKRYVVTAAQLGAAGKQIRGVSFMAFRSVDAPALYLDGVAFHRTSPDENPPAPPPPPPKDAGYLTRWTKAMDHAAARDYEAALRELDDPEKNARDAVGRAEVAFDVEALRAVRALHDRAIQAVARWPRGFNLALGFVDEAGKALRLDEPVVRGEATRLELRREKGTLTVEFGEILPSSLLDVLRKGDSRPFAPPQAVADIDASMAALFCLLEGDLEGAERQSGGRAPDKYVERARQAAAARSAPRELEARRLLARAHAAHRDYLTRAEAGPLYRDLLKSYADTALVRRNRASLQPREDAARDYFFGPGDAEGAGLFYPARLQDGRMAWTCDEDDKRKLETSLEFTFSALADLEYRAWIYAGGCCAETFAFSVQGTEMAGAEPGAATATAVQAAAPLLAKTHAAHGGRRKEPTRWEWVPVTLPRFASPGLKKLRVLSDQQGFSVAWVIVSAVRTAPPKEAEARELERDRPPLRPPTAPTIVTGKILMERWNGIPGGQIHHLTGHPNFLGKPSASKFFTVFEAPRDAGEEFGVRIRGYLHPPATGPYSFWIASDKDSELWLSPGEDPARKTKIASCTTTVPPRDWAKSPNQKSAPVVLTKNRRYYVEVLHKEGKSTDHVAVGWQLPDGTQERPIPGNRLSPFVPGPSRPGAVLTNPLDGSVLAAGATLTVTADYFGGLPSRADVFVASRKQGDARTDPITFTWQNVPAGSYPLLVRAVDKSGLVVFSPPATIRVGDISFYRGINLNGPPVTIDGSPWEGRGAPDYATNGHGFEREEPSLRPPTDAERSAMIRASVYTPQDTTLTLTSVPAGTYLVYLYLWEDNEPQTFDLFLNGKTVQSAYSSGQAGRWDRLGPWTSDVKDGKIELRAAGGAANFSGVEVWKLGGGSAPPEPKTPTRTALVGGEGGLAFEELAGDRGCLAGFKLWYGPHDSRRVVRALQAVYMKEGVRTEGDIHGKATPNVVEVLAKPGYAVGGIVARGSTRLDGLRVIFMKVGAGGRLQPSDRYESDWVGGPGGGAETTLACDGSPIIGLHGRKGGDADAIGLVLLK